MLYNGIELAQPDSTDGNVPLLNVPLTNIDRIEVVSGSNSVIYGSGNTAGVINIITNNDVENMFVDTKVGAGKLFSSIQTGTKIGETTIQVLGSLEQEDSKSQLKAGTEKDLNSNHFIATTIRTKSVLPGDLSYSFTI